MLRAHELRIGNWYFGDVGYFQITPEDIQDLYDDPLDDFYKTISITPEILEKCGFQNASKERIAGSEFGFGYVYRLWPERLSPYYWIDGTFYIAISCQEDCSSPSIENIQYLHQLQNLYFALTGEELTVNL